MSELKSFIKGMDIFLMVPSNLSLNTPRTSKKNHVVKLARKARQQNLLQNTNPNGSMASHQNRKALERLDTDLGDLQGQKHQAPNTNIS